MRRAGVAVLAAIILSSCGSQGPTPGPSAAGTASPVTSPDAGPSTTGSPGPADAATLAYGAAAVRDPSLTYQPDVVFVGGGPAAIRWASANGLVWAIDRNAAGAADLKVDAVMFMTSRAVGRVADIQDDGDSRIVTLAPVDLGELITDGTVQLDQGFDLGTAMYQTYTPTADPASAPDASPLPSLQPSPSASGGAFVPPVSGGGIGAAPEQVVAAPGIRLVAAATGPKGGTLPPPVETCPELTISNWSIRPCLEPGRLSVGVATIAMKLKLTGTLTLLSSGLRMKSTVTVNGGKITNVSALLNGITGLGLTVSAGVADPAQDNTKIKFEVPVEVCEPVGATVALPMMGCIEFKVTIETAFSGKNSTLSGTGAYTLTGPIGVDNGTVVAPALGLKQSLLNSLEGITLGPSGIVIAARVKVQAGVGAPGLMAGPYVAFTAAFGISKGSSLGASLATCRGVSLDLLVTSGAGLQIDVTKLIGFLPTDYQAKYKALREFRVESEVVSTVFSKKQVLPDVPLCRG